VHREVKGPPSVDRPPDRAGVLPIPVLVSRLLALLDSTAALARQFPADALATRPGDHDRTPLELAYHVPQLVVAFLDSALGGRLTREHLERRPPQHVQAAVDVARLANSVSQALAVWWSANQSRLPSTVDTYYGVQPLASVLAQTTLHVAQHARQLEQLLESRGITPQPPLAPALLNDLPLPANVWDDGAMPG
jgi:hypothetical protein